ncbi:MAG TPA: C25 family cysteine peptidase [Thermoanaerobaculia bacterium]|nr:C25 family cysteine peptidase [Thermoanaerobaculia bacterium]
MSLHAQTTFVRDTFTGTSGTLLESHAPDTGGTWTRLRGDGLRLQSNHVETIKTTSFDVYANAATPPSAEYVVGITVTFTTNFAENYAELYARMSGSSYYVAYFDAHDNYVLARSVGGTVTVLASGTTTATNALGVANEFVLSVTNASKRLIINGTVVATSTDNSVTVAGVAGFGLSKKTNGDAPADDFYGSTLAPTAVEMDSMRATGDGRRTLLEWTTGRQSHNLGYRVWRDGVCLTTTPIAGSAFFVNSPRLAGGTSYRWVDEQATPNASYWIEELDVRGTREWHGPIVPRRGVIGSHVLPTPRLSELTRGVRARASHVVSHAATAAAAENNFDLAGRFAWKVGVATAGIYEMAIPAGADRERLRLFEDGREVPIVVTTNAIRFYGTPLDTATSGTRTYWLTSDEGVGARMSNAVMTAAPLHEASGFIATVQLRDKRIFDATLVSEQGDGFFGPVITDDATQPARQVLRLEQLDRNASTAEVTLTIQGATEQPHRVAVALNGTTIGEIEFEGRAKKSATLTVEASLLREGDNEIALLAKNGVEDVSAIELVRLAYSRRYAATNGELLFTAPGETRVRVEGITSAATAFDITDPASPVQLAIENDTIAMTGSGMRIVLVTTSFASPARLEANVPSNLHDTAQNAFVMLAPRAFHDALQPLAAARANALLVDIEDVYDEYSFGAKDPQAIRSFVADARPRAVLLAGDGSYDPRDFVGGAASDVIPVHFVESAMQRTPSDAWFTDFGDDGVADIGIGRLPARDATELQSMVAKILDYERDATHPRDVVYVRGSGGFAEQTAVTATHIDIETEGVVAARQNLLQRWANGAGIIHFGGHGSVEIWESSAFFNSADAKSMTNAHLPLVVAMTCLNGYFHDLMQDSLAESLLRNANGGAAAVWAFSTLTEPAGQLAANEALLSALATGKSLGDATRLAQRATVDPDVRSTLLLFGDPTMRMNGTGGSSRRRAVR